MGFVKGRRNDLKGPPTQAVRGREAQACSGSCPRYGDSDDMSDGEDEEAGGRKVRREKNVSCKARIIILRTLESCSVPKL